MRYLLLCFTIGTITTLGAQNSAGTSFWLAFMESIDLIYLDAPRFSVIIDADQTTNGEIVFPATGLTLPFTASAGSITEILFNDVWYALGSETIEEKGIRINTEFPVRVSAMHYRTYYTESTQVLPLEELGTEYMVSCYLDDHNIFPTSLVITATTDNTTIEITPSTLTLGLRPPGIPFTVELDEGETYQVQAEGDLTGTVIRSLTSEPIAVFSGARRVNVNICTEGADSHLYEQAIPVTQWGETYYFVPFKDQGYDVVKVVALTDNTIVNFDCIEVAILNAGEQFITQQPSPVVINGTGPIAVSQFSTSMGCSPSLIGDPNMMRLLPAEYVIDEVRFLSTELVSQLFNTDHFDVHYVNVIMSTTEVGTLQLDGESVSITEFLPFPDFPSYSYAQLQLESGIHTLSSNANFQAYSYGFGEFDAYTTRLGYNQLVDVPYACLDIEVEGSFCLDSLLTFSYLTNLDVVNQAWTFNGLDLTSEPMPQYTFSAVGNVEVELTVELSDGSVQTTSLLIDIMDCGENICDNALELSLDVYSTACINYPIPLNFNFEGTLLNVLWTIDNGFIAEGEHAETVFNTPGVYTYSLTVTDVYNCEYFFEGNIDILDCEFCQPEIVATPFEGALCVDSTITFILPSSSASNPLMEIEWTINDSTFNEPNPSIILTESGTVQLYFFARDILGCTFLGELELEIQDCEDNPCVGLPSVMLELDGVFCIDSLITAEVQTVANLVNYEWTTTFGNQGGLETFEFIVPSSGLETISLDAQDALGCSYNASIDVQVNDCSTPVICDDTLIVILDAPIVCVDSIVQFSTTGVSSIVTHNWDFGSEMTSMEASPFRSYEEGNYVINVEVEDLNGCVYTAFTSFVAEQCTAPESCRYDYPNVFTPNSDGVNDIFDLLHVCSPESYELLIFNRWGAMVFKSTDVQLGWDGTFKGKPAPIDVYVYLAVVTEPDGTTRQLKGNLSLLR